VPKWQHADLAVADVFGLSYCHLIQGHNIPTRQVSFPLFRFDPIQTYMRPVFPLLLIASLVVAACAPARQVSGINDPFEKQNRKVHAFNKQLDKTILKPAARDYGKVAPGPVATGINNFASNLSLPRMVLNDLLQLRLNDAVHNSLRMTINTTLGVAGLFDVASRVGIYERPADFGQTLYRWGIGEGAYLELPVLGPSTERDALGSVVDFLIDPVDRLLPRGIGRGQARVIGTLAHVLKKLDDRDKYSGFIDSVLYESVDSYAQGRLLYLQKRRQDLTGGLSDAALEDPYAQ